MTPQETERAYDAGYTNALLQLRTHIRQQIEHSKGEVDKVLYLINVMLEVSEDKEI